MLKVAAVGMATELSRRPDSSKRMWQHKGKEKAKMTGQMLSGSYDGMFSYKSLSECVYINLSLSTT